MKKIFAMILVFAIIFLVTACSSHPAIKETVNSKHKDGYIAGARIGMLPVSGTENPVEIQTLLEPWEKVTEYGQAEPLPVSIKDFLGNQLEWNLMERNQQIPDRQRILPALSLPDKTGGKPIRFTALWTVEKETGKKGTNSYGRKPEVFFRTGRLESYQIRAFCSSRGP